MDSHGRFRKSGTYYRKDDAHSEGSLEGMKSVAEHQKVPKEEAVVKTVTALKKRYRDWHLAVRCHSQLKEWIQGNVGSRKKLAAACRGMTRHAGVAQHKGHGHLGRDVRHNQ
jgi:hypothetical protein